MGIKMNATCERTYQLRFDIEFLPHTSKEIWEDKQNKKRGSKKICSVVILYIVLNVHAPTEDKDDNIKESFYEELEQYLISFLRTI
jgi:hypothetical protein